MRVDDVRLFLHIADCGSFTAAAARIGSNQPHVSRRIAALEAVLGSRLFERGTAGVRLTAAGRAFERPAAALVDTVDTVLSGRARGTRPP